MVLELPPDDELWDLWFAARAEPGITREEFAARFRDHEAAVVESLRLLDELTAAASLPSLVPDLGEGGFVQGDLFAGYRLVRTLGAGTFGRVFEAHDVETGKEVALKVVNPVLGAPGTAARLFEHEAFVAGKLDHPNILQIKGSGRYRGWAWIASELVEGTTLAELVTADAAPEVRYRRALAIGEQVAEALVHAHTNGVVHRDLKPENILIDGAGRVKVLDFGLARAGGAVLALTATGEAIGTPMYMAPEQARGDPSADKPVDIYALGLILLELSFGGRLEPPARLWGALIQIAIGRTPLPRGWLRSLPRDLAGVVSRCVEAHPDDRYPSAEAARTDLAAIQAGKPPVMGRVSTSRRWARRARRHPRRVLRGLMGALAVLGAWWYLRWMAPVPVYVDAMLSGKALYIDGVLKGVVPLTTLVRPGRRELLLCFGEAGNGGTEYRMEIDVPHRARSHHFLPLNYWAITPALELPAELQPKAESAWVHVGTPLPLVDVELDGLPLAKGAPGIHSFRAARGPHRLRLSAPGHRAREIDFLVDPPLMATVACELDAVGDPWTTLIAYSPIHARSQGQVVDVDGLWVRGEYMRLTADQPINVHKLYWGPQDPMGTGFALLRFPLNEAITDLRFDVATSGLLGPSPGAWVELAVGPSPGELLPVASFAHSDARRADLGLPPEEPTPETIESLVAMLGDASHLFARIRLGGGITGDTFSYVCALRTEGFPQMGTEGQTVWEPALRIQLKHARRAR